MTITKRARDFLDKELFVDRSIVTFRSLSRELGIHVNDAKNELKSYYDAVRDDKEMPAVPTYLVSGELPALTASRRAETEAQQSGTAMDLDLEFEEDEQETDVVYQSRVLLVDASALNETMSQFVRIHSVHIYSLSPSRLQDAGLVCAPTFKVHEMDVKRGLQSLSIVGKITGPHVKLKAGIVHHTTASSSKTTLDAPSRTAPKAAAPTKAEQQSTKSKSLSDKKGQSSLTTLVKTEPKDKLKPSGKLDWFKAKEEKIPKLKQDSFTTIPGSLTNKKTELTKPPVLKDRAGFKAGGDVQKRGTKRKPHLGTDMESDSEASSAKAKSSAAVEWSSAKKGVISSDEDDEEAQVRMLGQRRLKRRSTIASDSETSLRAMMDIDDDEVDHVPRVSKVRPQPEEEESEEEDNRLEKETTAPPVTSEGEESEDIPAPPKKRKPRKVLPVGRNGVKKRRVIKSRTTTDAKGYMQTEDYSSYESVEEEDFETKAKTKGKVKETKKVSEPKVEEAKAKAKVVPKEENTGKPKAKPSPKTRGGAPKRGGLLNFFGPEKGKK
ncbi:DNA polymerase subunit Cdc27 [Chiua virens]|nr:DNA polymerase subunit Cdc27 [Chiua virens]